MYRFKHRPQILSTEFLNNLYIRSIAYTNNPVEHKRIELYIHFIEEYVQGLQDFGYMNVQNRDAILSQIYQLSAIRSLPPNMRGAYGLTDIERKIVYVNPDLPRKGILTPTERVKLYTFHELGHIVHDMYSNDINNFINTVQRTYNINGPALDYVAMGFDLIDETTVQDTAETIAYGQARKQRPPIISYKIPIGTNRYLYGKENVVSNFDYYGEMEAPITYFTLPLRGIGCTREEQNVGTMVQQLSKRSFEPNFIQDIISEFDEAEKRRNLVVILNRMGIIKDASYALFGNAKYKTSLANAESAYDVLRSETQKLKDFRPRKNYSGQSGHGAR